MSKPRDDRQKDLLLPALDQIIDLGHPLVRLAALIDWKFLDERFSSVCQTGLGQPGLPTRLVAGLFILKHMHNLSDARWIENPYYQYFCGELSFCHRLLKFLRTRLGRIIRDIRRKIDGDTVLEARFGPLLGLAQQVRSQDQHQRGPKVYALHAPEVECIGKGNPLGASASSLL